MKKPSKEQIQLFSNVVWAYYRSNKRDTLPWRIETDPYSVLMSEIMLQQTQVVRVVDYYKTFKKKYKTVQKLADADFSEVLKLWQGLGYNRRAKFLHNAAKAVVKTYKGKFPKTQTELEKLPGIGKYTSAAIMAFSYNEHSLPVETNIRSAVIYHFYKKKLLVSESDITQVLAACLEYNLNANKNPREWYWALMDYGVYVKQTEGNLNKQSKTYTKQSRFEGSSREKRSALLRCILNHPEGINRKRLLELSGTSSTTIIDDLLVALLKEKMIVKKKDRYYIA